MKLKNRMQGKVRIRATGTQLSRFLSLLLSRGILYEKAMYEGNALFLEISAGQYRQAVACAKKSGVRIRIAERKGATFFFFRHRRRKWAILFVLPALIMIGILPRFIWSIEIEGLRAISQVDMLGRLEKAGIHTGMPKSELDTFDVKENMLLAYEDLSWLSLSVEGTVLKVKALEAVAAPDMVEREAACDVVAAQNCVIYSIVTESGTPLVKQGDVVKQGEVMILGEVTLQDDDGNKTAFPAHAAGEVFGKCTWRAEESIERLYNRPVWKDELHLGWMLRLGAQSWVLRNPFGKSEMEASTETVLWRLPFWKSLCLCKMEYEPYELEQAEYTREEMEQRLRERLEKKKAELMAEKGRVALDENWNFEETDAGMTASLKIVLMEEVGQAAAK